MTLNEELVRRYFLLYTDLPEQDAPPWEMLWRGAITALTAQLRTDIDTEAHQERLCAAAALWAGGAYDMWRSSRGKNEEVRVGDIVLKNTADTPGQRDGQALQRYALSQIRDLLRTQDGFFLAVAPDCVRGTPVEEGDGL